MLRALLLALPVLVIACASEPPPPPVAPVDHSAEDKAALDASMARVQGIQQAEAASHSAAPAAPPPPPQESPQIAVYRQRCEDSRTTRLEHVKLMAAARMNAESKLLDNGKAIRSACKLGSQPTGAATVQRANGGLRVSPEMRDDVQCSRALPKGVTKDDAYVVLFRDRAGEKGPLGPMLASEDHSPDDGPCQTFDNEAGLNLEPKWDTDDVKALMAWGKPKS